MLFALCLRPFATAFAAASARHEVALCSLLTTVHGFLLFALCFTARDYLQQSIFCLSSRIKPLSILYKKTGLLHPVSCCFIF